MAELHWLIFESPATGVIRQGQGVHARDIVRVDIESAHIEPRKYKEALLEAGGVI